MKKNKKEVAAIVAVIQYIKTEEEMLSLQLQTSFAQSNQVNVTPISNNSSINMWGITGRGIQMQMRSLMQSKSFHRNY